MKTILVVDDEPDIIQLLVEILRGEGYDAVPAGDGVAALEALTGTGVDLVITDTMMPRLGGVELIRAMREDQELADIPVILMSAAMRPVLDGFGACVFLPKPFDLAALLEVVTRMLDRPPPHGSA